MEGGLGAYEEAGHRRTAEGRVAEQDSVCGRERGSGKSKVSRTESPRVGLCWEDREAVCGGPGHQESHLQGCPQRPVHLPGVGGQLPSEGQGLLGLKDKGGQGQGKERVAGLNGPEEKKT